MIYQKKLLLSWEYKDCWDSHVGFESWILPNYSTFLVWWELLESERRIWKGVTGEAEISLNHENYQLT